MTSRYRLVMRAYPRTYRDAHGEEVLDTARALDAGSWSVRQASSLILGGFRTRSAAASNRGARSLWSTGLRVAVWLRLVVALSSQTAFWLGADGGITSMDGTKLMPLTVLALVVMSFTTRWPAAAAVTAVYVGAATGASGPLDPISYILAVPSVGAVWWLALRTDGRRVAHPATTVSWIVGLIAVGLAADDPLAALTPGYLLLAVAGLALLLVDPRIIAIVACTMAFQSLTTIVTLSGPQARFDPHRIAAHGVVLGVVTVALGAAWYSINRATRHLT